MANLAHISDCEDYYIRYHYTGSSAWHSLRLPSSRKNYYMAMKERHVIYFNVGNWDFKSPTVRYSTS